MIGPNGSRKSTLVGILATLVLPDAGWARVFGHDVVAEPLSVLADGPPARPGRLEDVFFELSGRPSKTPTKTGSSTAWSASSAFSVIAAADPSAGICAFGIGYGLAISLAVLVIAPALFKLDLFHANLGAAAVVLLVSTMPVIELGVLASVLPLLSPERGEQMTVAVQGVLLLASGVYHPLSVLPAPLQLLGQVSPLTYALDGVRTTLLDGRCRWWPGGHGALGIVLVPLGLAMFSWAERRAKRLGLLKRSG